ncbi:MAG TPA: hypothetical protein VFX50_08910, partial [Gemmatimonadales bacterium]|nr:hypothetical protein [Gemmatimonadales bacterium]
AAAELPAWTEASELPVVARGGRLIGALRHSVLTQALGRGGAREEEETLTIAGLAAQGYWDAVSGLVRAFLGLLPRAGPVSRGKP